MFVAVTTIEIPMVDVDKPFRGEGGGGGKGYLMSSNAFLLYGVITISTVIIIYVVK